MKNVFSPDFPPPTPQKFRLIINLCQSIPEIRRKCKQGTIKKKFLSPKEVTTPSGNEIHISIIQIVAISLSHSLFCEIGRGIKSLFRENIIKKCEYNYKVQMLQHKLGNGGTAT